jgi:hypothetical protein
MEKLSNNASNEADDDGPDDTHFAPAKSNNLRVF